MGYGHAVRCLRLAEALKSEARVIFYPLSDACAEFLATTGDPSFEIRDSKPETSFPPLVITDLRAPHGITAKIRKQNAYHISIHDLGLAQCGSDIVIDGSVMRLFPYPKHHDQKLFLGPQYMITREPVQRRNEVPDNVLITFGGGSTARFAQQLSQQFYRIGLNVVATSGFVGSAPTSDSAYADAVATCRFAVSGSGVSLYELLASGVPTVAVAFDRLQLRTADAFHELGAVVSAGLMEQISPAVMLRHAIEMLDNRLLAQRVAQAGKMLVDGKGLSRVVEIVRRQLWRTCQTKTYMTC